MTDKVDTHQKPNPFDPERFRISSNSGGGNITRKLITTIPVRKPTKQAFVRCNSADTNRAECGLLTIEGDDRPYIVYPEIAHLAGNELKLFNYGLRLIARAIIFYGLFLCPRLMGQKIRITRVIGRSQI